MKRIAWLTDIHLNFVGFDGLREFLDELRSAAPDEILLSGDIAESQNVVSFLERMDDELQRPIHFVLGNHDFYFSSIAAVRGRIDELCARRPRLRYLTHREPQAMTRQVGLIGHDGWADGRAGDYERSQIIMTDYGIIADLAGVTKQQRLSLLHALGDEAAAVVRRRLQTAVETFQHVMLVSHVPPLREACWHAGHISDDQWSPHFVCQAMGEAILEVMRDRRDHQLTVFCGHTHSGGECRPLENVVIHTGAAEYGRPEITRLFTV